MDISAMSHMISTAFAMGVGATFLMDVWNVLLTRGFGIPSLNYCLLGRWLLHMPGGTFRHASIGAAARKHGECAAGWIAHYTIGVTLSLGFVVLARDSWLAQPTLLPALMYGVITVAMPLFVMQPAMGLGVASSKTAKPWRARAKSIGTHVVFGVGLFVTALMLV